MGKRGIVYLVGAGPGDQKLMTVKGLEVLRKADVILYDRLVNPLLLQEARFDAELIYCGKLPDRHILRQEVINQLLVEKAQQGMVVVRLKGGDPGVFGRVGEEADALKRENLPYEIIPGITSGIAAASYAGIPVTHREYGTSFAIVTGHDKSIDGKPLINWSNLANGIDTMAFYMGVKNLSYICEQLVSNGRSSSTKVAVIQWGTTGRQKVVEGTLATIVKEVEANGICNPAITFVGNIVELRQSLKWFEEKPLLGRKIMMPKGNEAVTGYLTDNGAEVLSYPQVVILPLTDQPRYLNLLNKLASFQQLYFTSKESVCLFFDSLISNKIDIRSISAELVAKDIETLQALLLKGMLAELQESTNAKAETLLIGEASEAKRDHYEWLVTHRCHNHLPVSVAFNRVMDEESFNTLIFTSPETVELYLDQVVKDGHQPYHIANQCQVVCFGEDTLAVLKEKQLPYHHYRNQLELEKLVDLLFE